MRALLFLLCCLLIASLIFCSVIRASNGLPPLQMQEFMKFLENLYFPSNLLTDYLYNLREINDNAMKAWVKITYTLGLNNGIIADQYEGADELLEQMKEQVRPLGAKISDFLSSVGYVIFLPIVILKDFLISIVWDISTVISWLSSFFLDFMYLFGLA